MTEEQQPSSPPDEMVARHRAMSEAFEGKRPMDWSIWGMVIDDSTCLTSAGRRVAHWAVKILHRAFGDDFLERVKARMAIQGGPEGLGSGGHPVFSLGFWPANDVAWVYANVMQLAAQLHLLQQNGSTNRLRLVLKNLRANVQPVTWIGVLLQLEVASLGLKAGWEIQLEPPLGARRFADVLVSHAAQALLVETTVMQASDTARIADALCQQVFVMASAHDVTISGVIGWHQRGDQLQQLVREIDQRIRLIHLGAMMPPITKPDGTNLSITPGRRKEASLQVLFGVDRLGDRLIARLAKKNQQAAASAVPVWLRLDEYAGFWQVAPLQEMTLAEKLDELAPFVQQALSACPHLAGVILAPAVLWADQTSPERVHEHLEQEGSMAVCCPLPGHRARQTIIIPRAGLPQAGQETQIVAEWYAQEESWLDWALQECGHPPFEALVQE